MAMGVPSALREILWLGLGEPGFLGHRPSCMVVLHNDKLIQWATREHQTSRNETEVDFGLNASYSILKSTVAQDHFNI